MPRLMKKTPSYRKHNSGQAVVTIGGKDFYLGPYGTKISRFEYDRIVSEWLASGRRLPASLTPDTTVAELCDRFWTHAQAHYVHPDGTPTGETGNYKLILRLLNERYGRTLAAEFRPLALQAMRGVMVERGWVRGSINRQIKRLCLVFQWGASQELLPAEIPAALRTVSALRAGRTAAKESEPVLPVDDEVVEATLPHLSATVAAMVQLQRLTGARPGEVCAMKIGEVERTGDAWRYSPTQHKTAHHGKRRIVFIGPRAQAVLQPFLRSLDPQAFVFRPADALAEMRQERAEARTTPLSCGNVAGSNVKRKPKREAGESYDVHAYRRAIARGCDAAFPPPDGLDDEKRLAWISEHRWNPNRLRHAAATEVRAKFGIEAAQHVLGHATTRMTEVYAERDAADAARIAAKIG